MLVYSGADTSPCTAGRFPLKSFGEKRGGFREGKSCFPFSGETKPSLTNLLFKMDFQRLNSQQDPVHQKEGLDADEGQPQYRGGKAVSGLGRGGQKKRNDSPSRQSTPTGQHRMSLRERTRGVGSHTRNYSVPASEPPGMFQKITNLVFSPSFKRASARGEIEQHKQEWNQAQNYEEHPPKKVHDGGGTSESISMPQNDIIKLQQEFRNIIEGREREWEAKKRELQRHIEQISQVNHNLEEDIHMLQSRLTETNSEKLLIQEQHNDFIRKQQEASFRQMESARWLPMDEGKVVGDLDRLKRSMRTWAKTASIKDLSLLSSLKEVEYATLMEDLGNVALIENGQLPEGLSATAKSPMLLLNALLAHSVYTSFFRSPFFFLGNNDGDSQSNGKPEGILEDIYGKGRKCKLNLPSKSSSINRF